MPAPAIPPQSAPAPNDIDDDIASFLASADATDDSPSDEAPPARTALEIAAEKAVRPAEEVEAELDAEDGDEPAPDTDSAEPAVDDADSEDPGKAVPAPKGVDVKALSAAIEKNDPAAFVKALGPAAEELLSSKAHKALRLQVKELEQKTEAHQAAESKAADLAGKLETKYGDPIRARQAAAKGDPDGFIDMVEKWSGGYAWADIMKWVANAAAGRPAKLEERKAEAQGQLADKTAKQEQAQAEAKVWVARGVKAIEPALDLPLVHDMVYQEIREGFAKGINTPAKAMPAVKAKLKAQYDALHKVFGAPAKPKKGESPSARAAHTERVPRTRETTVDEDIADFMRSQGLK